MKRSRVVAEQRWKINSAGSLGRRSRERITNATAKGEAEAEWLGQIPLLCLVSRLYGPQRTDTDLTTLPFLW